MVIWKLEVAVVQGSRRSGAIQILDSMNAFFYFFMLDYSEYKSLYRTRMRLHLSQDLPSLHSSAVNTFMQLHLAEGQSVPHPQPVGSAWRQPATAETSWAVSWLVTSVPGRKNTQLYVRCIRTWHNK